MVRLWRFVLVLRVECCLVWWVLVQNSWCQFVFVRLRSLFLCLDMMVWIVYSVKFLICVVLIVGGMDSFCCFVMMLSSVGLLCVSIFLIVLGRFLLCFMCCVKMFMVLVIVVKFGLFRFVLQVMNFVVFIFSLMKFSEELLMMIVFIGSLFCVSVSSLLSIIVRLLLLVSVMICWFGWVICVLMLCIRVLVIELCVNELIRCWFFVIERQCVVQMVGEFIFVVKIVLLVVYLFRSLVRY